MAALLQSAAFPANVTDLYTFKSKGLTSVASSGDVAEDLSAVVYDAEKEWKYFVDLSSAPGRMKVSKWDEDLVSVRKELNSSSPICQYSMLCLSATHFRNQ